MAVVTGISQINVGFNQAVSAGLVKAQTLPAAIAITSNYTNGTGANQIDLLYAKQLTFVASTPQTLDLTAIVDLAAATVNMARVRDFFLQIVTATVDFNITLGAAAANPWAPLWGTTGTQVVFAGTTYHISDPTTVGSGKGLVTSGTSKSLKIDPGSNVVVANLIIAGCSAVS